MACRQRDSGYVVELLAAGRPVRADQPLARMRSRPRARLAHQVEVESHARAGVDTPSMRPLASLLEAATNRVAKLGADQAALVVRARHDGLWVAPDLEDFVGRWIPRGTPLGLLANSSAFLFTATVKQEEADRLFGLELKGADIRLHGQVVEVIRTHRWQVVPGGKHVLPSPALGWQGGGKCA
jgi:putative peptide zinc metalloprotease protein